MGLTHLYEMLGWVGLWFHEELGTLYRASGCNEYSTRTMAVGCTMSGTCQCQYVNATAYMITSCLSPAVRVEQHLDGRREMPCCAMTAVEL